MLRYTYINQLVLSIYKELPIISFPINPQEIIKYLSHCRYMSYQKFMKLNGCTLNDVIQICESKSGCTHYDIKNNRYLILCNESTDNNNNEGRQRWTCSHEIGHIVCEHHSICAHQKLSENSLLKVNNPDFEMEADYFASVLLAPFPLFKLFNIQSAIDVQNTFGLSAKASLYRYKEYLGWKQNHRKTSWENDIVRVYKQKR